MSLSDYSHDFLIDPQHVWLNVASEGPLPQKANEALLEAVQWKLSPHRLTIPKFQQVPVVLKQTIAQLLSVDSADIILGNSATYGLHLLANGLNFKAGDEILLLRNDFPTDILPWLSLQEKGVIVRQIAAKQYVLSPQEIADEINPRTKLICLPLIHSFTGFKSDIHAIGKLCRKHGILCIVNIAQAAGAFEINLDQLGVDAAVCAGYKWLLGPYGTGFVWIKKEIRQQINYPQNYWISLMDEKSLNSEAEIILNDDHSSRRYDIFGTANFFNYVPWTASMQYLLSIGIKNIHQHNQALIDQLVEGLDRKIYDLISPYPKNERTNIMVFSCKGLSQNALILEALNQKGYHIAFWKNKLRVSPHLYNTPKQIEALLEVLNNYAIK